MHPSNLIRDNMNEKYRFGGCNGRVVKDILRDGCFGLPCKW